MADQDWLTPATAPTPSPYQNVFEEPSVGPPAYELRPLTLGELLDRTFSLYRSRFWLFAGISAAAAAVELVAAGIGRVLLHRATKDASTLYLGSLAVTYGASFIYFFVYCVTQAATCFAMAEVYLSRPVTIGSSFSAVRGKWYAWIGIGCWQAWSAAWIFLAMFIPWVLLATLRIAFGAGIMAGLLTFVLIIGAAVYGVIAYIRNSLAIPAKVVEGMTVRKAMRRSKDLASSVKGRIFVLGLIVFAMHFVAGVLEMPFALTSVYLPKESHIISEITVLFITFLAHTVVTPIASIGLCLIYFDQRVRHEAFDLEILLGPEQASVLPSPVGEAYTLPVADVETPPNAPQF